MTVQAFCYEGGGKQGSMTAHPDSFYTFKYRHTAKQWAMTNAHYWVVLSKEHVPFEQCGVPLLNLSLSPLVPLCLTQLPACRQFFYDTLYMVHDSRTLGWFDPWLFYLVRASSCQPFDRGELISSVAKQWCEMGKALSGNRDSRLCRGPGSRNLAMLCRSHVASCTWQVFDAACFAAQSFHA